MHLTSFLLSLAAFCTIAASSPVGDPAEPEISVVGSWPESNPFGHVVNGERNVVNLNVENKANKNVTLLNVAGSILQAESNALIKNLTVAAYNVELLEGVAMKVPYTFYSEFKPGDHRLHIRLTHESEGEKYEVTAFDSIITVVEPELSILDFKMISTYLVILAIFGGAGYFAYVSFVPRGKKAKRVPTESVSAPVGNVTATGAGGYQEEWIPEHHIRKTKRSGAPSSGDELSGGEVSGTEGKRRKGRK